MTHHLLRTVISGSYGKHFTQMLQIKAFLESQQIIVQAPVSEHIVPDTQEFILLSADPVDDHRILQDSIFAKIKMSSFLTLANIGGYIGNAALLEMGYAVAMGIKVLTVEQVLDPNLAVYTQPLQAVFPAWAHHAATLDGRVPQRLAS